MKLNIVPFDRYPSSLLTLFPLDYMSIDKDYYRTYVRFCQSANCIDFLVQRDGSFSVQQNFLRPNVEVIHTALTRDGIHIFSQKRERRINNIQWLKYLIKPESTKPTIQNSEVLFIFRTSRQITKGGTIQTVLP